jgi:hypothetical protein
VQSSILWPEHSHQPRQKGDVAFALLSCFTVSMLQEPIDIPLQQVCPELADEAVDYEEPASRSSDGGGCLYAVFAIDTQTSQQHLDSLKEAMLQVRFLSGATCFRILSQHVSFPPGLDCRHKLGPLLVLGADQ